jgi:hypothetical protein
LIALTVWSGRADLPSLIALGLARRIVKSGGNNRKKLGIGHLENGDRGSGGGLEL